MSSALEQDQHCMRQALRLASHGEAEDEVPVGALLVRDGEIIAEAWNRCIGLHDPSGHAEILALRQGAQKLQNYRLLGTTLYVTLEPCVMCLGAIIHARVERLVYGAPDPKTGAVQGRFQLLEGDRFNHRLQVSGGVLAEECGEVLRAFFRRRR